MNSLIIPAYNEEARIERTIRRLLTLKSFELIFVVSGNDKTWRIVSSYARKNKNIKLFSSKKNGKWRAVLTGFSKAGGELIGFVDADLPVKLSDIINGFKLARKFDIVIGSRSIKGSKAKRSLLRAFYSRLFNYYVRLLFRLPFKDTQCGFKVLKKKAVNSLLNLKSQSWEADVELLFKARNQGFSITELPVTWREIKGSKLKPKAMIKTVFNLLKLRLTL